jgi:pyruvate dehydrogenase E2 component (dihydrolipoamide acetyltransferase)
VRLRPPQPRAACDASAEDRSGAGRQLRFPRAEPVPVGPREATQSKPHASPSVRKFARELGADLSSIRGSGPKGRILREDVQGFVKGVLAKGAACAGAVRPAGRRVSTCCPGRMWTFAKFGPVEMKPLSRIRKLSGANLRRNWVMIPHVTQFDEADITDLEAFRKQNTAETEKQGFKLTMLSFLIKASVTALRQHPDFNASLDKTGTNLVVKKYFNVGVAVDTPDGLVVPVVRDADRKGVFDLARELAEISKLARDKKLKPGDMQGGTFSISSLGGIGGTAFTPIINAPEVAILGVAKSVIRPMWNGKEFAPRLMLPLALSYDHRVDRRRRRGALHRVPRQRALGHPPDAAVDGQPDRSEGPRYRRLQGYRGDRGPREAGRCVQKEQSLITLESDKATMEIPSPASRRRALAGLKLGGQGVARLADPATGSGDATAGAGAPKAQRTRRRRGSQRPAATAPPRQAASMRARPISNATVLVLVAWTGGLFGSVSRCGPRA